MNYTLAAHSLLAATHPTSQCIPSVMNAIRNSLFSEQRFHCKDSQDLCYTIAICPKNSHESAKIVLLESEEEFIR